jgi:hypothetical protein
MNPLIGTGYHYRSEWDEMMFELWRKNTETYGQDVVILSTELRAPCNWFKEIWSGHNLGHVGEYCDGKRTGQLCGWSASIVTLSLIAYNAGKDFAFKEGDCLWFGDVIGQMYRDMGDKQMVFGRKMESAPWMGCAQSTFLIRHNFIPEFVSRYLALPEDKDMLPENKFTTLEEQTPEKFARLSFGVDRERPIPWDEPVWYCQQWTGDEIQEALRRKII